jgi:hypothetical protein
MSTNIEALIPRNLGWLRHGHLDRVIDPLSCSCSLDAFLRSRLQVLPESDLMRLYPSFQLSTAGGRNLAVEFKEFP